MYNKWITQDCCQEINSNLTQGIGFFKKVLCYLIVQTPFRKKIFLMKPSPRLPRKCEIPAEVNGVHPTTVRVQKYKEVSTAWVMHIMVDGISFIICLGYKRDKISLSLFYNQVL